MVFLRLARRNTPIIRWHGKKKVRQGLREIGNTPIVEILFPGHAPILVKAEHLNPTESHKDRAYYTMILDTQRRGILKPGMTIVDYTTGNGGAACAYVGRELGYNVIVTMPENMTYERIGQIKHYGAELVVTPKRQFVKGAKDKAVEIANELGDSAVLIDQSDNPVNIQAFKEIGIESLEVAESIGIRITNFVGAIGTGANVSGIAQVLKENDPTTRTIGLEAAESPSSYAAKYGVKFEHCEHGLIGTSPGKVAANTLLDLIDVVVPVDQKGREIGVKLLRRVELALGWTSAANLYVAKLVAKNLGEGNRAVLTIGYDAAWKYYSDDIRSCSTPLGRAETIEIDKIRALRGRYNRGVVIAP